MDINDLHKRTLKGNAEDEGRLFEALAERFRLFVEQRIEDQKDCEDVVQESLLTVAKKYRQVELTRNFAAWAYGVLQNNLLHYYRSRRYNRARYVSATDSVEANGAVQIDPILESDLRDCLRELCRRNLSQARVLNFVVQGYAVKEVCRKLGLTPNACHIQLSRARASLRACLHRKKDNR